MPSKLITILDRWEIALRDALGADLATAKGRRLIWLSNQLLDHAFLRVLWTNHHEILKGIYRSNHPSARRLRKLHKAGFRSVLSLRGSSPTSYLAVEREACSSLGLELETVGMSANKLPARELLLDVLKLVDGMPKPLLIHCKSGADRTGLIGALVKLHFANTDIAEAKKQLSWRYLHLRASDKGILDALLDDYEVAQAASGVSVVEWLENSYDPDAIAKRFKGN